jgi:hypothetical protein
LLHDTDGLLAQGVVVAGITALCVVLLAAAMHGHGPAGQLRHGPRPVPDRAGWGGLVYACPEGWQRSLTFADEQTARTASGWSS